MSDTLNKDIFAIENFADLSLKEIFEYYEKYDYTGSKITEDFTRKKTNLIHHNPFEVEMENEELQKIINTIFKEHNNIDGLLIDLEKGMDHHPLGRVAVLPRKVKTPNGLKDILLTATPDIIK